MPINDIVVLNDTDYISDSRQSINDNFEYLKNRVNSIPQGPQGEKGDEGLQGFPGPPGQNGRDGGTRCTMVLGAFDVAEPGEDVCPPYIVTVPGIPDRFYMKAQYPPIGGFFQLDIFKSTDMTGTTWQSIFRSGEQPKIEAGSSDWISTNVFFPGTLFQIGQLLKVNILYANNAQVVVGVLTWKSN